MPSRRVQRYGGTAADVAALLDDAVRFAKRAGAAGVPATLEIWPHKIHAWPLWNAKLAGGRRALEQAGAFIRRWVR